MNYYRTIRSNYLSIVAIALLLVASLVLHFEALDGNWRWDDTAILKHILFYGPIESIVNPSVYAQFSSTNLFPWVLLSFEFDFGLFGLNPRAFYIHQLLSIGIAAVVLFFVSKQWMRPWFAFISAILFLSGTPVAVISEQLMTRHYIEGLIFSLLSLLLITRCLRDKSDVRILTVSALLYLLAITCKEVYIPLFLLIPFISDANLSTRLKATLPFALLAGLYIVWRAAMLSTLGGGM